MKTNEKRWQMMGNLIRKGRCERCCRKGLMRDQLRLVFEVKRGQSQSGYIWCGRCFRDVIGQGTHFEQPLPRLGPIAAAEARRSPLDPKKRYPKPIPEHSWFLWEVVKEIKLADAATRDQQPPIARAAIPDVTKRVVADLEARSGKGEKKYGTVLQPMNGRNALIDAYQEGLDLVKYLAQALEEAGEMHEAIAEISRAGIGAESPLDTVRRLVKNTAAASRAIADRERGDRLCTAIRQMLSQCANNKLSESRTDALHALDRLQRQLVTIASNVGVSA